MSYKKEKRTSTWELKNVKAYKINERNTQTGIQKEIKNDTEI
jgi:hypothetical protein